MNAVHERWVICNARHISLCRDWTSCFGFLLTHRTYLWNCHEKFYCSFFCLSMEISPRQFWGSWFHTKSRFPTGNSHLPRGKTGCITAPIKYDNFTLSDHLEKQLSIHVNITTSRRFKCVPQILGLLSIHIFRLLFLSLSITFRRDHERNAFELGAISFFCFKFCCLINFLIPIVTWWVLNFSIKYSDLPVKICGLCGNAYRS